MIPNSDANGFRSVQTQGQSMSLKMDRKAAQTLSSTIYSSHRIIEAMIREICCNAADGHTMANRADEPFEVTLPTDESPMLIIRDFGIGMSHDDGVGYMTVYFNSGSEKEKRPTGYYGLGSKSPMAYTDSYTVEFIQNGLKSMVYMFKDGEGMPSHAVQKEREPTEEPDGVTFSIPIFPKDIERVHSVARSVLAQFSTLPIIKNARQVLVNPKNHRDMFATETAGEATFKLYTPSNIPVEHAHHPAVKASHLTMWMGNILYPLPVASWVSQEILAESSALVRLFRMTKKHDISLVIHMDIAKHAITVEPGREMIETHARNMHVIEEMAEKICYTIHHFSSPSIVGLTPWQMGKKYADLNSIDAHNFRAKLIGEVGGLEALAIMNRCRFSYHFEELDSVEREYGCAIYVCKSQISQGKSRTVGIKQFFNSKSMLHNVRFEATSFREIVVTPLKSAPSVNLFLLGELLSQNQYANSQTDQHTLVIRARNKDSRPEEAALALFGKGEYRVIDTLDESTVEAVKVHADYRVTRVVPGQDLVCGEEMTLGRARAAIRHCNSRYSTRRAVCLTVSEYTYNKDGLNYLNHSMRSFALFVFPEELKGAIPKDCNIESFFRTHYHSITSLIDQAVDCVKIRRVTQAAMSAVGLDPSNQEALTSAVDAIHLLYGERCLSQRIIHESVERSIPIRKYSYREHLDNTAIEALLKLAPKMRQRVDMALNEPNSDQARNVHALARVLSALIDSRRDLVMMGVISSRDADKAYARLTGQTDTLVPEIRNMMTNLFPAITDDAEKERAA